LKKEKGQWKENLEQEIPLKLPGSADWQWKIHLALEKASTFKSHGNTPLNYKLVSKVNEYEKEGVT